MSIRQYFRDYFEKHGIFIFNSIISNQENEIGFIGIEVKKITTILKGDGFSYRIENITKENRDALNLVLIDATSKLQQDNSNRKILDYMIEISGASDFKSETRGELLSIIADYLEEFQDHEKKLYYRKEAFNVSLTTQDIELITRSALRLINDYLYNNQVDQAGSILGTLEQLSDGSNKKFVQDRLILARALIDSRSERLHQKLSMMSELEMIVESEINDVATYFQAVVIYCELLLIEYNFQKSDIGNRKLRELFSLLEPRKNQFTEYWKITLEIIYVKFLYLENNYQEAMEYLKELRRGVSDKGALLLIDKELKSINKLLVEFCDIKTNNENLIRTWEKQELTDFIEKAKRIMKH